MDSGNSFQTDGVQQLKAYLPNSDDNVLTMQAMPAGSGYLTEGIEWVVIAEITDAGKLVVLLTGI